MRSCNLAGGLYVADGLITSTGLSLVNNTVYRSGAAMAMEAKARITSLLLQVVHDCERSFGIISAISSDSGAPIEAVLHRGFSVTFTNCNSTTQPISALVGAFSFTSRSCKDGPTFNGHSSSVRSCGPGAECVDAPTISSTYYSRFTTPTTISCICTGAFFPNHIDGTSGPQDALYKGVTPYVDGCLTPREARSLEYITDSLSLSIRKTPGQPPTDRRNISLSISGTFASSGIVIVEPPSVGWLVPLRLEANVASSSLPKIIPLPFELSASGLSEGEPYQTTVHVNVHFDCNTAAKCPSSNFSILVTLYVTAQTAGGRWLHPNATSSAIGPPRIGSEHFESFEATDYEWLRVAHQ